MLDKLRHTVKHTVIYSIGNISTKLIGLILLPLYTGFLTTAEYGMLSILEVTSTFLVASVGFRLSTAMMRWYAVEKDVKRQKNIVLNSYLATFLIAVLFLLIVLPFNKQASILFFEHTRFANYFTILFGWVVLEIINRVTMDLIRLHEKSIFFITIMIVKFISILLLNILFVAQWGYGVEGIILSQLLGNLLVLLITSVFIAKNVIGGKPDIKLFREMVSYGFPLIFSTVSMMVLTLSDRYLLKELADYSSVGIYSLAYKLAGVINIFVIQSFQLGFLPVAYKMFEKEGAKEFFAKVLTYLVLILFLVAFLVSFFSKEVIMLFAPSNKNYWIAYTVVPLLSFTFILKGMNYMFSLGLHYVKKTRYNAYIVSVVAILNILLNIVLIPEIGIYGAAITTIISNIVMVMAFYHYSQKFYYINFELKRLYILFSVGTLWLLGGFLSDWYLESVWSALVIKVLLFISFPFILSLLRFFEKIEVENLSGAWKKWSKPSRWIENIKKFEKH